MPTTPKPALSRWCDSVKPAGPSPTTSTFLPMYGRATGRRAVERVPAREQAVDLEAPAHPEHVGQHARLRLRDVDRLLLLEDARLHAVVADAVAGAGEHRVVDDDHRQRRDRVAVLAQHVHLADLLVERAAGELDAQRVPLHRARLVVHARRARVLLALVAVEAVVGLARDLAPRHARVGQREAVAPPPVLGRPFGDPRQLRVGPAQRHQVLVVDEVRKVERHPARDAGVRGRDEAVHRRPALEQVDVGGRGGVRPSRARSARRARSRTSARRRRA